MSGIKVGDQVMYKNEKRLFNDLSILKEVGIIFEPDKKTPFTTVQFKGCNYLVEIDLLTNDLSDYNRRRQTLNRIIYVEVKDDDPSAHISSYNNEPKIGLNSIELAIESAYRMAIKSEYDGLWVHYLCPICKKWHIGKWKEEYGKEK